MGSLKPAYHEIIQDSPQIYREDAEKVFSSWKGIRMTPRVTLFLLLFPLFGFADDFSNREAVCHARASSGIEFTEKWKFSATDGQYTQTQALGITRSGRYETPSNRVLKIFEEKSVISDQTLVSNRKFDLKYKLTSNGFKYFWEGTQGKDETQQLVYLCTWTQ